MGSSGDNDHIKKMFSNPDFVKAYENTAVVTGAYASLLLEQLGLTSTKNHSELVVLDQACGTGVVAERLYKLSPDGSLDITCTDFSEGMLNILKQKAEKNGWKGLKAYQGDAQEIKQPNDHFTHLTMTFGPFVLKDPVAGLAEANRVLRPGGKAGFTTWQHLGWYPDFKDAFGEDKSLPPFAGQSEILHALATAEKSGWDDPAWIEEQLKAAGFVDVKVEAITKTIKTASLDLLWPLAPQLIGLWIAPWSEEDKKKVTIPDLVKQVKQYMGQKYGDGEVPFTWTGLVTTAKKPE